MIEQQYSKLLVDEIYLGQTENQASRGKEPPAQVQKGQFIRPSASPTN